MSAPQPLIRRLMVSPSAVVGGIIVAVLVIAMVMALVGATPYPPAETHPESRLQGPSWSYLLGTDLLGRDVLSRVLDGVRLSLQVSIVAVAVAAVIGSTIGLAAGFFGRWLDTATMRVADVFFAFPAILLALAIVTALGSGWRNTAIAIAVVYTPIFARVARGPVLSLRTREYVEAAEGLGFHPARILVVHVLPNVAAAIIVQISLALSWAILTESSLSFLGLGAQPPQASLGLMIADSRPLATTAWWTFAGPAVVVAAAVIGFNLLGDGLRDALDPTQEDE
ncbi:ABC transporter permease [Candidatus Poriferisocius sp.]|uniref:ABC transporter permease n=1 Tax=Candidatus Poriferisocius sp. TaxID=3101276 RepID=UPI003B5B365A